MDDPAVSELYPGALFDIHDRAWSQLQLYPDRVYFGSSILLNCLPMCRIALPFVRALWPEALIHIGWIHVNEVESPGARQLKAIQTYASRKGPAPVGFHAWMELSGSSQVGPVPRLLYDPVGPTLGLSTKVQNVKFFDSSDPTIDLKYTPVIRDPEAVEAFYFALREDRAKLDR